MKTRLLGALVGLAISFALPTFAQQKEAVDPQLSQQLAAISTKQTIRSSDCRTVAAVTPHLLRITRSGALKGENSDSKIQSTRRVGRE